MHNTSPQIQEQAYAFIKFIKNPLVELHYTRKRVTGLFSVFNTKQTPSEDIGMDAFEFWCLQRRPEGHNIAFKYPAGLHCFKAENITNGIDRPVNTPNAWVADFNDYRDALKKYEIPIDEDLIIPYDLTLAKVKIYVNHLLQLDNPPDAIFTINDPTAIEAIKIIHKKGLRVPEDIAVVGFSNDYVSELIDPPLTTVSQPVKEMGSTAARLLIDQINREVSEWKSIIRVLKTELIVRKSS